MSELKLLPCPFCGGEAKMDAVDRLIRIGCEACRYWRQFEGLLQRNRSDVPITKYRDIDGKVTEILPEEATEFYHANANEEAAAAWNRRPPVAPAPIVETERGVKMSDLIGVIIPGHGVFYTQADYAALERRLRAAEAAAALDQAREDAERYRWLKKSAFCNVWERGDGIALVVPRAAMADIDSRIDAAMRKGNGDD